MKTHLHSVTNKKHQELILEVKTKNAAYLIDRYTSNEPFISGDGLVKLSLEIDLPELVKPTEHEDVKKGDEKNSISLHKALVSLTPSEASSKGVWTWMALGFYWDYMRSRWPIEDCGRELSTVQNHIMSHYLIAGQNTRSFIRGGISRLWWYAELTYDNGDYANLAVLLRQLDIASTLLERTQGRNPELRKVFFRVLLERKDEFLSAGNTSRERVRFLAKKLNFFGSSKLIDALTARELEETMHRISEEACAKIV